MSTIITPALIEELKASLTSSTIVTPSDESYPEAITRWSSAAEKPAGLVVFPKTASDISHIILFCARHNIEIATSCGRHSTSGASSTDGGLVIDLSHMRNVVVDPEAMTITAEGGCTWEDVDNAAAVHGLATVGGTVNHTGIGGLTLGGGYGWLSGQHGLVIDNLLSVSIVLANGDIVTASSDENPDLFFAIRGAGQCFGIVTSFVYLAHSQGPVYGGILMFPSSPEAISGVTEFMNHLVATSNGESAMIVAISRPPFGGDVAIGCLLFYNGSEEEGKRCFGRLLDMNPLVNQLRQMEYRKVNEMMNPSVGFGGRKILKGSSFLCPVNPGFVMGIVQEVRSFTEEYKDAGKSMVLLEAFSSKAWEKKGMEEMAFANRGPHLSSMVGAVWGDSGIDNACRQWCRKVAGMFTEEFENSKKERGLESKAVGEYANYDGIDRGTNAEKMFGVNYKRLTDLKRKYDPENLFRRSYAFLPVAAEEAGGVQVPVLN
ncbi:hypothetical protein BZA77DRAFT_256707 [Pyronema omphalodes]|nr:hypothetical protein BZA77DRAFT_256707 [Pyronema omphalodes]